MASVLGSVATEIKSDNISNLASNVLSDSAIDVATGLKTANGTLGVITSEDRARTALYADPVTLNFKLLIDFDCEHGLFGNGTNSAISYFKRIGDKLRLELMGRFINEFKKFIQYYDFLFLGCEGLQEIFNRNAWLAPNENEDKVIFTIRETLDLRVQALITMYNNLWWDDVRMVEVLPANLRRFNCCILVYSSSYFDNLLYGIKEDSDINSSPGRFVLPTKVKLDHINKIGPSITKDARFNHIRVNLIDAQIDTNESGKTFFSELSNEMQGDYVKNSLGIKYRFSNTTGLFTNVSGNKYISDVLIVLNEMNKANNKTSGKAKLFSKEFFKKYWNDLKDSFNNAAKQQWNSIKEKGQTVADTYTKNLGTTHIGNALNNFLDPSKVVGMVDSAVTAGVGILENRVLVNVTELENLVSQNFSPEILTNAVYDLEKKFDKELDKTNVVGTLINKGSNAHGQQYIPEGIKPQNTSELGSFRKVGETPDAPNLDGPQYSPEAVPENIVKGISFKANQNAFNRDSF